MTLLEIKKKTINYYASWWTILVIDPIAFRIVWLLQRAAPKISPNLITSCSLVVGCLSAWQLASANYLIGGILYEIAFLLDCIDGKMARLQNNTSPFGAFFDGFVNSIVYALSLIGLGYSLIDKDYMFALVAGALLLHIIGLEMAYYQSKHGRSSSSREPSKSVSIYSRLRKNKPFMWPDRHLFVFCVFPMAGYALFGIMLNVIADCVLQFFRFINIVKNKNCFREKI